VHEAIGNHRLPELVHTRPGEANKAWDVLAQLEQIPPHGKGLAAATAANIYHRVVGLERVVVKELEVNGVGNVSHTTLGTRSMVVLGENRIVAARLDLLVNVGIGVLQKKL
jgi:hypothetical protein